MWGRGCTFGLLLACVACPVSADEMEAPSGQFVSLSEVRLDDAPGELWLRFRFIAPEIARDAGSVSADVAMQDLHALCNDVAAPYAVRNAIEPARIVVSFSDRVVPFGQSDPAATQFFELYSLQDGACIWEEF